MIWSHRKEGPSVIGNRFTFCTFVDIETHNVITTSPFILFPSKVWVATLSPRGRHRSALHNIISDSGYCDPGKSRIVANATSIIIILWAISIKFNNMPVVTITTTIVCLYIPVVTYTLIYVKPNHSNTQLT